MALVIVFLIALYLSHSTACPDGYTYCGVEGGSCVHKDDQLIAFGANDIWAYAEAPSSIITPSDTLCNTDLFGDPDPSYLGQMQCCR